MGNLNPFDKRTKWARFHDKQSPLYGTDNGAPCSQCGGHVYGFKVSDVWNRETTFDVFCYGCHTQSILRVTDFDKEKGAAGISASMREQVSP